MVQCFKQAAPQSEILVLYGSTEAEPIAHIEAAEMPEERSNAGVCVGKVCEELDYRLLKIHRGDVHIVNDDWSSWAVPNGMPGELIVSGSHVCRNYYNNPEATRKTKIKESNGTVWHRTGDVGFIDEKDSSQLP